MSSERTYKMGDVLPPVPIKKMPKPPPSYWQTVGPDVVLGTLSSGAGELVLWPLIVCMVGPRLLWLALIGGILQYFWVQEIARYTIATGESTFVGFMRTKPGWFWPWFYAIVNAIWISPAWVGAGATSLAELTGIGGRFGYLLWSYLTLALIYIFLGPSKVVYRYIEILFSIVIAIGTIGSVICIGLLSTPKAVMELLIGMFSFGYIPPTFKSSMIPTLLTAVAYTGNAGTIDCWYSFWLKEKNMGMGAYVGRVTGLRGKVEEVPQVGYMFDFNDEEQVKDFWTWLKYCKIGSFLWFWLIGVELIIMLYSLGALVVLVPAGLKPTGLKVAVVQAEWFRKVAGEAGYKFFLLALWANLWDAQFGMYDSMARTWADTIWVKFESARKKSYRYWYWLVMIIQGIIGAILLPMRLPLPFMLFCGLVAMISMPIICLHIVWINNKYLPKQARPSILTNFMMAVSIVFYTIFAIIGTGQKLGFIKF